MGQFLSNKYLKYRAAMEGRLITEDSPCPQCEYNRRGLKLGGACPECGLPITIDNPFSDALCDAPPRVIRNLSIGFFLAFFPLIGTLLLPFVLVQPSNRLDLTVGAIALGLTIMWTVGVWFITQPIDSSMGVKYRFGKSSRLRIAARFMQWPWVGMGLIAVGEGMGTGSGATTTGPIDLLTQYALLSLSILGLAGVVVLGVLLQELAHWSFDLASHRRLSWAIWGIPIAYLGLVLPLVAAPFGIFTCLCIGLWMFSILSFASAMYELNWSLNWSLIHSHEKSERDRRRHRRKKLKQARATLEKMSEQD